MLSVVKSMSLQGLDGYLVSIQVDISAGLPCFEIVGLPDIGVKESKERVKTAIKNSGADFFSRRIIVNLAPANIRKEGSVFDLPIAVGILIATGNISNPYLDGFLRETIFIGELSLNGNIEKVKGALPIAIEAKKMGIKRILLPEENSKEAAIVDEIEIISVKSLRQIIEYLNGKAGLKQVILENKKIARKINYECDFSEVKGQQNVKRALEVAASGGHNCALIRKSWFGKNDAS